MLCDVEILRNFKMQRFAIMRITVVSILLMGIMCFAACKQSYSCDCQTSPIVNKDISAGNAGQARQLCDTMQKQLHADTCIVLTHKN